MTQAERREQREALMVKYEQSAMSKRTFAEAHGIKANTFYRWARQRDAEGERKSGRFVQVCEAAGAEMGSCCLQIGETTVRVTALPSASWVAQVLRALWR